MGFFSKLFGDSDTSELKETNKALVQRITKLESENTELREQDADDYHEIQREAFLNERMRDESQADFEHRMERRETRSDECSEDAITAAKRTAAKEAQTALDKKADELAVAKSENRELTLQLEEQQQETDLAIQEGILEYKEEHLEDMVKLQVSNAELKGEVKAAQADGKSKDQVIKILTDLLTKSGETNASLVEAITEVAPKINLEKLGFEVTVPVAAKQSGEQKKQ